MDIINVLNLCFFKDPVEKKSKSQTEKNIWNIYQNVLRTLKSEKMRK